MGYFRFRIYQGVSAEALQAKADANLALYEPGVLKPKFAAWIYAGRSCSALFCWTFNNEEQLLFPIGYQFGCVWMDVRYQDGDVWDLTCYEGVRQVVSHSPDPWVFDPEEEYDQKAIDWRIARVCELWVEQAPRIERYLLPWRIPVRNDPLEYVEREGKAYDSDEFGYGDAYQIYDFIAAFGINEMTEVCKIVPPQ